MKYYRNNRDVVSIEGIPVEECSLWKLDADNGVVVLVDEDQYATHKIDKELFDLAE